MLSMQLSGMSSLSETKSRGMQVGLSPAFCHLSVHPCSLVGWRATALVARAAHAVLHNTHSSARMLLSQGMLEFKRQGMLAVERQDMALQVNIKRDQVHIRSGKPTSMQSAHSSTWQEKRGRSGRVTGQESIIAFHRKARYEEV